MPASRRSRLSVFVTGIAVIAAALVPTLPAAADEVPTPDPTAPVVEPTPSADPSDPTPPADPTPPDAGGQLASATIQGSLAAPTMTKTVNGATFKLTAALTPGSISEPGVKYAYQWYRVNRSTSAATAISGATKIDYTPVAADYAYKLKVRITVTKTGYTTVALLALPKDYSLRIDTATPLALSGGPAKVFNTLSYNGGIQFTAEQDNGTIGHLVPGDAGLVGSFQWYRTAIVKKKAVSTAIPAPQGTAIPYSIIPADAGKTLNFRLNVSYPGYLPVVAYSPKSATVALATFAKFLGVDPQVSGAGLTKHVTASVSDVNPSATALSYQWTRDGVAIPGATKVDYTLTAADYGKTVRAKVTYTGPGYAPFSQSDVDDTGQYWVRANSPIPVITGQRNVGGTLAVDPRLYFYMPNGGMTLQSGEYAEAWQWLRAGVAIAGATGPTYTLTAADKGKAISVRMTVHGVGTWSGVLPSISTSVNTPPIGQQSLPGTIAAPPSLYALPSSTGLATVLGVTSTQILSPNATPNTVAYQWLRDGAPIAGATKATYALTQADRGHLTGLRIVTSHAPVGPTTYTTDVRYANEHDFTLNVASSTPGEVYAQNSSTFTVGGLFAATQPSYADYANNAVFPVTRGFQWLRNGVAIAGPAGTGSTYVLQAADVAAKISVRITTGAVGYTPVIETYTTNPATLVVGKGSLNGGGQPTVTAGTLAGELVAMPPAMTGTVNAGSPSAVFVYQWLRNGVDIAGATKQKYVLTAADAGKNVKVRVTATLPGYTSVLLPESAPVDYTISLASVNPPYISFSGGTQVGGQVDVYNPTHYTDANGFTVPVSVAYQWFRTVGTKTTAIAGATSDHYPIVAADYGSKLSLRAIVTKPGYVTLVHTFAVNATIGKGVDGGFSYGVVQQTTAGVLTAAVADLTPQIPAPTYVYKWYRANPATPGTRTLISGATAKNYKLVAADFGKLISVQITMTRVNFTTPTIVLPVTAGTAVTIYTSTVHGTTTPVISGSPKVGELLAVTTTPDFWDDAANTSAASFTPTYTWYRSGVAIPGATGVIYRLVAADLGKVITVRVNATAPGRLAATSVASGPTGVVTKGLINQGGYAQGVTLTGTTAKITSSGTLGWPTSGVTTAYRWTRDGVAIPGKTTNTYVLTAADTGHDVSGETILTAAGYDPLTLSSSANDITADGSPVLTKGGVPFSGQSHIGETLSVDLPQYFPHGQYPGGTALPASAVTVQWYQFTGTYEPIPGATSASYVVAPSNNGRVVVAKVTILAPFFATVEEFSGPTFING